jgi:hypothetical protein
VVGIVAAICPACATTATTTQSEIATKEDATSENPQTLFDSPNEAMKALMNATQEKDKPALRAIFGPHIHELSSGDEVEDRNDFENFARRLAAASRLVPEDDNKVILHLGMEDHPFPVPLVKAKSKWFFDTAAGLEEILNRRIGENEIKAAAVCRGYVEAQREYALADRDDDGVMEYAQRIASTPGKHDGLFWETSGEEPPSPLGALVAEAREEGYAKRTAKDGEGPRPYHGYLYRILTKQGSHAPGGKFDYVINGHLVAGFALIAYPVDWGSSGVMTFIVNSNGKVLQKNLGEKTAEIAAKIDVYDPDDTWTPDKE